MNKNPIQSAKEMAKHLDTLGLNEKNHLFLLEDSLKRFGKHKTERLLTIGVCIGYEIGTGEKP